MVATTIPAPLQVWEHVEDKTLAGILEVDADKVKFVEEGRTWSMTIEEFEQDYRQTEHVITEADNDYTLAGLLNDGYAGIRYYGDLAALIGIDGISRSDLFNEIYGGDE